MTENVLPHMAESNAIASQFSVGIDTLKFEGVCLDVVGHENLIAAGAFVFTLMFVFFGYSGTWRG